LPGSARRARKPRLNPYIEDVARRLSVAGFLVAPDELTSVGGYPGDDEKGWRFRPARSKEKMEDWAQRRPT